MNSIFTRLKKLEREADGGYSPSPSVLMASANGWRLTFNLSNNTPQVRQFVSIHGSESEGRAEFERLCNKYRKHRRREKEVLIIW